MTAVLFASITDKIHSPSVRALLGGVYAASDPIVWVESTSSAWKQGISTAERGLPPYTYFFQSSYARRIFTAYSPAAPRRSMPMATAAAGVSEKAGLGGCQNDDARGPVIWL